MSEPDLRRETLASRWAEDEPDVRLYACNTYARHIAKLRLLKRLVRDQELQKVIDILIDVLKDEGTADWIASADVLTNLGLRVGSRVQKLRW